jgi:hypothetical protein
MRRWFIPLFPAMERIRMAIISESVIAARKSKAVSLGELLERSRILRERLQHVADTRARLGNAPLPVLERAQTRLREFSSDVETTYRRFNQGLVTIAMAGLEKAGKTTFLRSLTGINGLPAAPERCTAVGCEILFDPTRNDCELEFYSEKEYFAVVVAPIVNFINEQLEAAKEDVRIAPVVSLAEFSGLALPPDSIFAKGTDGWLSLSHLKMLKSQLAQLQSMLSSPTRNRVNLSELRQWTAHPDADGKDPAKAARLSCIKRCRVRTAFPGGSEHLRWIDTPGIDDPNPRAVETTLRIIGKEADLLVVASKPAANPSPTRSFTNFWTLVDRLPTEIDLPDKLLIALNWHRGADPDGSILEKHRRILKNDHGVPDAVIRGPFEANQPGDAVKLMAEVNQHLAANLSGQDTETVRSFRERLQSVFADIRRDVYDRLRREYPKDQTIEGRIHKKIDLFLSNPRDDGSDDGFLRRIRLEFSRKSLAIPESEMVNAAQERMRERFKEQFQKTKAKWPTAKSVDEWKEESVSVIERGMSVLSSALTDLANNMCGEMVAFGPILQDWLVDVLDQLKLGGLMRGDTPAERLACLAEAAALSNPEGRLAAVLSDAANLPQNLQYMFRYELRPAINFSELLCWTSVSKSGDGGPDRLFRELKSLYKSCDVPLPQGMREFDLLPVNAPTDKLVDMFKEIANNSLAAIKTILEHGRCRLSRIAEDFARDCQIRLFSGDVAAEEWRHFVIDNPIPILGREIREEYERSEGIAAFREALRQLEEALG